jgi:hypothetical protein
MKTTMIAIWNKWKAIIHKVGEFQARVILSGLYFVVLGPFALADRILADPLHLRRTASRWLPRPARAEDPLAVARRQF